MAAVTIKITKAVERPDGSYAVTYDFNGFTGLGRVFPSKAAAVAEALKDPDEVLAAQFILAWWNSRSPNFTNQAVAIGKTMTIDFADPNPIKVQ